MSTITETYGKDIAFKDDFVLTATGDLDVIEGIENVKNALFRRLVTVPGSLVHRPEYGVGITLYQNALNSLDMRRKMALAIREQFSKDPRVESVVGVSFDSDDNVIGKVAIKVKVWLIGYGETSMTFEV